MKSLITAFLTAATTVIAAAQTPPSVPPPDSQAAPPALPQPATGRIERLANFPSKHLPARHVDVWLPADYSPARRYQVLYMHDGQMLFDARTTWNKQAWNADAAVAKLVREGRIADTLIVGIWNGGERRFAEYYPQKFLAGLPEPMRQGVLAQGAGGRIDSDAYLRFVVEELKPEIDRRYATKPGRESTFIAGSSMGGIISLYALCEYPQVFAGAAGLSTHWVGLPGPEGVVRGGRGSLPLAALSYFAAHWPAPGNHRVYADRGTDALDSLYAPALGLFTDLLRESGWGDGDARVRVLEGTGHNEIYWSARLPEVLQFLLGPR